MDKQSITSITSLPRSPGDDRRRRMIQYSVTMGIRMVCLVCMLFAQGWWLVVFGAGAIVLPYVAVVVANVGMRRDAHTVERPGHIMQVNGETYYSTPRETGGRPE